MAGSLAASIGLPALGAIRPEQLEAAADVLSRATSSGQVAAATLHVVQDKISFSRAFGAAASPDAMFLLGSISKPVAMTALMTLFDRGEFQLDDPLQKFIPQFTGDGRDQVTMQHLLTHVSGLPDQLPENDALRKKHAQLGEFVDHAVRTPLLFTPGSKYEYSSMAILLAARVAELIAGSDIRSFVERVVFEPLGMRNSAQGLGRFAATDMVRCQTEHGAPEAGGGDPAAKDWDWNSSYWRKLGAPWGGTHASAPDVGRFLAEFLHAAGKVVKPETARRMTTNHLRAGLPPRGLAWNIGTGSGSSGCSARTFGHTGSTGTVAWADPATGTVCVVLTSLPGRAVQPHPRDVTAAQIARQS